MSKQSIRRFWIILSLLLALAATASFATANPYGALPSNSVLIIPSLKVVVPITSFPLAQSSWEISAYETLVGHLEGTPWVEGNMVLAAHANYPDGSDGIFAHLVDLQVGDRFYVYADGELLRYTIDELYIVEETNLTPLYPSLEDRVTLITCSLPSFNTQTWRYTERFVVTASRS